MDAFSKKVSSSSWKVNLKSHKDEPAIEYFSNKVYDPDAQDVPLPFARRRFNLSTRMFILFPLLLLILSAGCAGETTFAVPPSPEVPISSPTSALPTVLAGQWLVFSQPGSAPIIDGTISPGEWDHALHELLSDGSELFFIHDQEALYVGIKAASTEMIAANIFIETQDLVHILHSSAALGTAVYEDGPDNWSRRQNFDWCCRTSGNNNTAINERAQFLRAENWVAANSRTGTPNHLEYQIEFADNASRVAVSFMRSSDPDKRIFWPEELEDGSTKAYPGGLPAEIEFSPEEWTSLTVPSLNQE
jgi:hypothetical protein